MKNTFRTSRRKFLKTTAVAPVLATPAVAGTSVEAASGPVAANDRIQLGLIGSGGRGMSITRSALEIAGTELVAAADCYDGRLTRVKEIFGSGVQTTRHYKEILARPDVDAVLIGTPDHWHAAIAVEAMQAGKHVYCEKPMVQTVEQGHDVIRAQKASGRVLQVGSQRVSSVVFAKAKELLQRGDLGTLTLVEASINRNSSVGAWQYSIPPDASPQTVDWDGFLGPAPKRPFDPVRFFRWRNYWDYGTGVPGDLFVHLLTGIHFLFDLPGPVRVQSAGGIRFWKDGRDAPDVVVGIYDYPASDKYPAFNVILSVNFADGSNSGSPLRIIGSQGIMEVDSDVRLRYRTDREPPGYSVHTFPEKLQKQYLEEYRRKYPPQPGSMDQMREEIHKGPSNYSDTVDHFRAFFTAIRDGKPVLEDAVFGLRAAAPAILCNTCYRENRICNWDPVKMRLTS